MSTGTRPESLPPINIIIPVYRGLEVTRCCLESVLSSELPSGTTITLIDDASPEEQLSAYCQALADAGKVNLLKNDVNCGFVVSVNRGFAAQPEADVLLLNSDTEVVNDWLGRLHGAAYRAPEIGTVTPFSNNATICSYPNYPVSGPMPALWNTQELDQLFRSVNKHRHSAIPTAVGFCMFIKRSCLDQVGDFDAGNFGLGYGEECDFSLRAQGAGWQNVIAADVFVFHEGAVSFSHESDERKEHAGHVMRSLHPLYDDLVSDFIHSDPLGEFREAVDVARLAQRPADAANLLRESSQRQVALQKHAADLRIVLRSERTLMKDQEKTLGQSLEQSGWLDKELRQSIEKSNWLAEQLKESLEKSAWLEQQLKESLEKSAWLQQQLELQTQKTQQQQQLLAEQSRQRSEEVNTLAELLKQSREDFSRTDEALGEAQRIAARLHEDIVQMKQSRSWRYTAWLRKVKGGL